VLDELFALTGRTTADYIKLVLLDPFYNIRFEDGTVFHYNGDKDALVRQVRAFSPDDVDGYLQLKFERVGVKLSDVFETDAMDAVRARLLQKAPGRRTDEVVSICYPLVLNNLVCRALNAAALVGYPKVDAQVIAGC
jgi:hypothetical protein